MEICNRFSEDNHVGERRHFRESAVKSLVGFMETGYHHYPARGSEARAKFAGLAHRHLHLGTDHAYYP